MNSMFDPLWLMKFWLKAVKDWTEFLLAVNAMREIDAIQQAQIDALHEALRKEGMMT